MNQLEQFREQCVKVVNKFVGTEQIVEELRALPLPEVNQDYPTTPNSYNGFIGSFMALNNRKPTEQEIFNAGRRSGINDNFEMMRKENEQLHQMLIEFNKIMTDSCDMPINPNEIIRLNEFVLKVRKFMGVK